MIEPEDTACPCCEADACDRRGESGAARRHPGAISHAGHASSQICVSRMRQRDRPGAGAGAADQGGLPTEAMVAHVLVSKYAWHLPLYRQAQMLRSQGIEIDRLVLAFWVGYAAAELVPLVARLREILLGSVKLAVDETPVPVLDPGRGRTKTGYFWSIARDDGRGAASDPPAVVLQLCAGSRRRACDDAARGLSRHRAVRRLCGLQAIGSTAGARRPRDPGLLLGHGGGGSMRSPKPDQRRSPRKRSADCRALQIEKRIRGRSAEERRAVRQAESKPLVDALKSLARKRARARLRQIGDCRRNPLRLNHWDGLRPLSRRRPHRDRHQVGGALDASDCP